jgi:DNA invertase Pin-like site-specific DNA recombinase
MNTSLNTGAALAATSGPMRAVQYVRKSDEHQKYSTENQAEANRGYAQSHGMEIVRTYCDDGISGLSFERRDALRQLIADVQAANADFEVILVYDVSRWGRFQDPDESAYYEFICKRAGIGVRYCAEPFENDGSPLSTLAKSMKRMMAGDYSRELSIKVFIGQSHLIKLGYRLGGYAGYGLRRMLVGENGTLKAIMQKGEHKWIATDRVVLVPGPPEEVETVRSIFRMFVEEERTEQQIANVLNDLGKATEFGRAWTDERIRYILTSEKYAGNNVWNQVSFKLRKAKIRNAPEHWVRADHVFQAIIEQHTFDGAQAFLHDRLKHPIRGRERRYSDKKMLSALRRLLKRAGHLSRRIIDVSSEIQSAGAYENRFGSLARAYQLIGYKRGKLRMERRVRPTRHSIYFSNDEMLAALRTLLRERGTLTTSIIEESASVPCGTAYCKRFGSIRKAYELIGFVPTQFAKRWRRPRNLSDEQMLDALRGLRQERNHLTKEIINNASGVPSSYAYEKRFGSIVRAYELVGYAVSPHHAPATRYNRNTSRVLRWEVVCEAVAKPRL